MTREQTGRLGRPGSGTGGRDEILEAAAVAFMRQGFAATSMDDIADQLGATKGRVYHYYRSKNDVFLDLLRSGMDLMLTGVEPLASGSGTPAERLRRMAREHALIVMRHLPVQRFAVEAAEMTVMDGLVRRQREAIDEIVVLRDRYEALFRDVIDDGVASGDFRRLHTRLVVKGVLGSLNWITVWYRPTGDDEESDEHIADTLAEFIVRGLAEA